ncbi:hypothetical protein cypCar_00004698 [Cyprinus carpio]|nr:hypothetical protein cypCar_00004698 [Cyprinus carpio]
MDICKSLWCHRTGHRCETKFMPAAEGTICGPDMWCRRGQCVKFGDHGPTAVHGQWSGWSEWSDCSRTCGGGVMYRERSCNSPSPQHNGKFCQGPGRLHQLCNTKRCQPNGVDFRAQQSCESQPPFSGMYYYNGSHTPKWKYGRYFGPYAFITTKANVSLTVGREHSKPLLGSKSPCVFIYWMSENHT